MHHIRTKLALLLLVAALLPVLPSYFLVKGLLNRGIEIGFNKKVESALEASAFVSRQLLKTYREETLTFASKLAESNQIFALSGHGIRIPPNIQKEIERLDVGKILLYDFKLNAMDSVIFLTEYPYPIIKRGVLLPKSGKPVPDYLFLGNDRRFILVYAPVVNPDIKINALVVIRILDDEITQGVQSVFDVNRVFQTLGMVSSELKQGLMFMFLIVYVPLAIFSIGMAFYFARRITSPLLELAKGTQIVAAGDWDYRMKISTKDEIGQLVEAFNSMIVTIKEKQKLAKKEEAQRIRIQEEAKRKAKDLEMSELKARALQAENERKNIELEKAQELQKAYDALETAHKELKDTQSQLIQSGKMAALGNLVAGVAHEINNPVGAINSAADASVRAVQKINTFLENGPEDRDIRDDKQLIKSLQILNDNTKLIVIGSSRVVKIVRTLKTFARLDEAEYQEADIHEGLDSTLVLLHYMLKNRIEVKKEYGDIPKISCYPNELNQVFMNILANAAQAIEDKGFIYVRTFIKKTKVIIEIEDTGMGILPEHLSQIFDPGFTTKGVGVGTGLGLSISYNIIQKHKGEIKIKSKPGRGSVFTISLPPIPKK